MKGEITMKLNYVNLIGGFNQYYKRVNERLTQCTESESGLKRSFECLGV